MKKELWVRILGAFIDTRKYYVTCSVIGGSVFESE